MTELAVQVIGDETTDPARLDEMSRELARDLHAAGPLAVHPVMVWPPLMSKSSAVEHIGYLVVSGLLSAATVRAIRDVVVAYLARTKARAVRVTVGDREVVLDGVSAADLSAVTKRLTELVEGDGTV